MERLAYFVAKTFCELMRDFLVIICISQEFLETLSCMDFKKFFFIPKSTYLSVPFSYKCSKAFLHVYTRARKMTYDLAMRTHTLKNALMHVLTAVPNHRLYLNSLGPHGTS